MLEKPRGPKGMDCPQFREPMNKVCHKCPNWVCIRGMDPQDNTKQIDKWECSIALTPLLLIELGRQIRSNAAAIETLSSEVSKSSDDKTAMIQTLLTSVNRSYDAIAALPAPQAQKLIS
jgi:hypothetical protein